MVRSYLDLTIKFHDYSRFFTAFDVGPISNCLGSKIKGFKAANWKNWREEVMTNLLKQKFASGTLLADKLKATAGKKLTEAGLSDTYSIGLQLHSKDVFNSTKWKQNLLGKMLMKIREELLN